MKKMFFVLVSMFIMTAMVASAQDQTRKQDRIHQEDHLMLRDGSCYLVKQGEQVKLKTQLKLDNGTLVNPDGSYQLKNQKKYQMRNGECMDMKGNRYLNQNKFNKRMMMTNQEIERVRMNNMHKNKPANKKGD